MDVNVLRLDSRIRGNDGVGERVIFML